MMEDLPLSNVYQFIEPGPVALLVTQMADAQPNVMTMTWHMMIEFDPPLIGCIISQTNHSFEALNKTHQCVIAVPPASMVRAVTAVGNCTGADTEKFNTYELTKLPAARVQPPLIKEAIVNLECKARDARMVKDYNLFVLECIKAWENPALKNAPTLHHHGYGNFVIDGEHVKMKSHMR